MTAPARPRAINILWFKRDLRVHDHAPLAAAQEAGLPVLPLYVVEPIYWQQPFASRRHWHFIHDCLCELRSDLRALGQPLIIRRGEVTEVLSAINQELEICAVYAHQESGNRWTYDRDRAVQKWCMGQGIALKEHPSNGVVRRLRSRDNWAAIRNARMAQDLIARPARLLPLKSLEIGQIPSKDDPMFGEPVPGIVQQGGRSAAVQTLRSFLAVRGKEYIYRLSAPGPSEQYCSRLSTHLAWGTLSVREVVKAIQKRRNTLAEEELKPWKRNLSAFSSRLAWRCHFIQKLEDYPELEHTCMHPAFEGLRENQYNDTFYEAWAQGRTGYPFIDACMRNLIHEGWITFRMRAMLVSFASYHLWLDWRRTGSYLARLFSDYEAGIHYSQLQMQSGVTGINTLRIYNPTKQAQEHDPQGSFVKHWVPELAGVSDSWIHEPWLMSNDIQQSAECVIGVHYPAPIVDHAAAVSAARARIAAVRRQPGFREQAEKVYQRLGSRKRPFKRRQPTAKKPSSQLSLL